MTVDVDLATAYDFPTGAGRYEAHYSAINPSKVPGQITEMKSEGVAFELR